MKTKLPFLMLLPALLMLSIITIAQEAPTSYFKVKGKVYPEKGLKSASTMKVYQDNKVVEVVSIKRNGKFKLWLESDAYYTLSVEMEGHINKKVVVSTLGVAESGGPYSSTFDFDVFLYKTSKFEGKSKDLLDYPTAMIEYNTDEGMLTVNEDYTYGIYRAQKELLAMEP